MANDVKWIKFIVGTFDGESFKKIKRAKIGGESFRDKLTAVWFELLDLAGKCNHNGAFINNNEMPYQKIEDIAIMLDRETEELELCMSFYIQEKMIEIIDNIYLLSNWEKYQSVKGLDDIREANRLRNIEYRKRKRELLIEQKNRDITDDVIVMKSSLSKSISNSNINIFNYWNNKNIIKHKELNNEINKIITKCLKKYSEEQIKTCIDRYDTVIKDKSYGFDYKWTLVNFLNQKNALPDFLDDGSKWVNYCSLKKPTTQFEVQKPEDELTDEEKRMKERLAEITRSL